MGRASLQKYLKYGYLIIISTVVPLYMGHGYYELGERKGIAYIAVSLIFALLFLVVQNRRLFEKGRMPVEISYGIGAFVFSNVLSFLYSVDTKVSFLGLSGWRSGLLTILLYVFFFFIFFEEEKINAYILAAVMITPMLESLLAILNRFAIYPVEIYGKDPTFLATIGNINWFVGYLSVFVPLGIGLCYTRKLFSKEFFFCGVFALVTLMALILQGSDSAVLVLAATYIVLLFFAISERKSFRQYLAMLFILGLSLEGAWVLYMTVRNGYTYQDNLLLSVCLSHVGLIIMAGVFFALCLSHLFEAIGLSFMEKTYRYIAGFIVALLFVTALAYVFTTFDYKMGNGRGLIYSMTLDMFGRMEPLRKLFGAGQDCFEAYAYSDVETADSLLNVFGGSILTNAHCAPLTILVERGMLGLLTYFLLIALFVKEIFRQKNKHAGVICALILSSYLINSFVSFETPLSTPYLFMAMAIGLSSKEITN